MVAGESFRGNSIAQAVTANDWENNFAFGGLAICLALSAFLQIIELASLRHNYEWFLISMEWLSATGGLGCN